MIIDVSVGGGAANEKRTDEHGDGTDRTEEVSATAANCY